VPSPSAFSLAAARMGWPLSDVALLSLHGRALDLIRPHLHPGARILALTSDGEGPCALAALLNEIGFGGSKLTVLEALGGPRERIRAARAAEFSLSGIDPLNVAALEVEASAGARILSHAAGLADALFEHDGQITKRELRAVTLSSLAPRRGERLCASGATQPPSACRVSRWSKAARRNALQACRSPMRCSSAAGPPSRACWTP
jgi:precorrin-6Y C5,15-methyltransferase (decarboxylating)